MRAIILTTLTVSTYILCCLRLATAPWKFWQLNAQYFSPDQGIFSKLALDSLIPDRWRLPQTLVSDALAPARYPVFMKPEWGQNSEGVYRVDTEAQLDDLRASLGKDAKRYMVQEGAPGIREFELFSIDVDFHDGKHDVFTVTETVNHSENYPVNSKHNADTQYVHITKQFSKEDLNRMAGYLSEVGPFRISRLSVRADDLQALVEGRFHVFEINLFLPMPINLLDMSYSPAEAWHFIRQFAWQLARTTKAMTAVGKPYPILYSVMTYGRRKRSQANLTSSKIRQHTIQP